MGRISAEEGDVASPSGPAGQRAWIREITPTVFVKEGPGGPLRLLRVGIDNQGPATRALLRVCLPSGGSRHVIPRLERGASHHELLVDTGKKPVPAALVLEIGGEAVCRGDFMLGPARRWTVHVVQSSHHDLGYTGLPSQILRLHTEQLRQAVQIASDTSGYPEHSRFRIVIEQAWSLLHFLEHAGSASASRMIELLRSGRFELGALLANMVGELCGHESMLRCLYPAFALKRRYGIRLVSAEHNDIPGLSWGMCLALTEAGIRLLCAALPRYYDWGDYPLQSFWDDSRIFPGDVPGVFLWESPARKRLLVWASPAGTVGGEFRGKLPELAQALSALERKGYPYSTVRYSVCGAATDNPPYIAAFADTIREWNSRWVSPHLISSTNAIFLRSLRRDLPSTLPVLRGELPGQDYPVGATSTAHPTAVNRGNHWRMPAAELLSSCACLLGNFRYPRAELVAAFDDIGMYDEHTWGPHFPCGPAVVASGHEKATHAHRAAALIHDASAKALACIADEIGGSADALGLVLFNPSPFAATGLALVPMRGIDPAVIAVRLVKPSADPRGTGHLGPAVLGHRWHEIPTSAFREGLFDLVDRSSGRAIPYEIIPRESPGDPIPFGAERVGVGSGRHRYGTPEPPVGLLRDLCFVAEAVPALGYRSYELRPRADRPRLAAKRGGRRARSHAIENEHYRIVADAVTGAILSLRDKATGRELVDRACPHGFLSLVCRDPRGGEECGLEKVHVQRREGGPVRSSLAVSGQLFGHPRVELVVSLHAGLPEVSVDLGILKDATPLLDVHLAFPFASGRPELRYEGTLSSLEPIVDYFPGAYSDSIPVQSWVTVGAEKGTIVWASLDAPLVQLSRLGPGYVSPAHRALLGADAAHPPALPQDLRTGWIYSTLFNNNFGTNFAVSQSGSFLFRYRIRTGERRLPAHRAASVGWHALSGFESMFFRPRGDGKLPPRGSFVRIRGGGVALLCFKAAEDGRGYVARFWNMSRRGKDVAVRLPLWRAVRARRTTAMEEDRGSIAVDADGGFTIFVEARGVATVRLFLVPRPAGARGRG